MTEGDADAAIVYLSDAMYSRLSRRLMDPGSAASSPVSGLTEREFELAVFLFRNVGRLVSRGHLLESLWGRKGDVPTRTSQPPNTRARSVTSAA